jgi:hypothetical protein
MSSQSNPELCSNDVLERAALTLVPSAPVPSTRQIALSRRLDAVLDDIGFGSAARKKRWESRRRWNRIRPPVPRVGR